MFRSVRSAKKNWEYHTNLIKRHEESSLKSIFFPRLHLHGWKNALNDAREFLEKSKDDPIESVKYKSRLRYLERETEAYVYSRECYDDPAGEYTNRRGSGM